MATIKEMLDEIKATKADIRSACLEKGVESFPTSLPFSQYGDKVREIDGGVCPDICNVYAASSTQGTIAFNPSYSQFIKGQKFYVEAQPIEGYEFSLLQYGSTSTYGSVTTLNPFTINSISTNMYFKANFKIPFKGQLKYWYNNGTSSIYQVATTINDFGSSYYGGESANKIIDTDSVKMVSDNGFYMCENLQEIELPACSSIGATAFFSCQNLTKISFPKCETIANAAFVMCFNIISADFPNLISIDSYAFNRCENLQSIKLSKCSFIGNGAFMTCYSLASLTIMTPYVCELGGDFVFEGTPSPIEPSISAKFYVPSSLVTQYQNAEYWARYSSHFVGV